MIYTAPCIMFWMRAYPLRGEMGGGWALEFSSFLVPVKWVFKTYWGAVKVGPEGHVQGPGAVLPQARPGSLGKNSKET